MKKIALVYLTLLLSLQGYSYSWIPLGTDSANTIRFCFNVGLQYWAICADNGMYLYNYGTHDCQFYTNGSLPVRGACYLYPDRLLVAMGNGSWSDGIYEFDWNTHEFEVLEWIPNPNFLEYHEPSGTYWLGTQFGGMYQSSNGEEWAVVPFFENKSCTCLEYYGEWMVVSEVSNICNIYWSDNSGITWHMANIPPIITDMRFDGWGMLYGIFPDHSNSSGLWFSEDKGINWEVAFYSDNMSAVGCDAFGHIFVGWEEDVGIAYYDPEAPPPGLTFLNNGLPDHGINKIQLNPSMSAPAIFICTDAGAYYSYDYMVGIEESTHDNHSLTIYPNPAHEKISISSDNSLLEISLHDLNGALIFTSKSENHFTEIDISPWPGGIYFISCTTDAGAQSRKCIIH